VATCFFVDFVEAFFALARFVLDFREEIDDFFFDDELFDLADFAFTDFVVVHFTRLLLLRAVRLLTALLQRTGTGFGRVHPISASARKAFGIASTGVGPSMTASTAASERSDLTSPMIFAGRCAFAACTRFVSSTTNISLSGSIQMDVPV
jgi:hypothetical protein